MDRNSTLDFSLQNEAEIFEGNATASSNLRLETFYFALLMLCCCVIGSVGNVLSFWIFTRPCMRSSPINVLLAALSAIDFSVLIIAIAVFVVPGLNTTLYEVDPRLLYRIIISGFYQFGMIAQTCSVWTFVLISLERYVAVCLPLVARQRLTVKRARSALILILILAFAYNVPRFFEYWPNENGGYAPLLRSSFHYFAMYFTTLYLLTHFLGPFLVISILNAIIFKAIRRAKSERRELCAMNSREEKKAKKHKITFMITLVALIFAICNILPFVLNIWEALDPNLFYGQRKAIAYLTLDISNVLVVLNSSTTFIVYVVYCAKYRSILRAGFRSSFHATIARWWRFSRGDAKKGKYEMGKFVVSRAETQSKLSTST